MNETLFLMFIVAIVLIASLSVLVYLALIASSPE
jgi:hypothetical protein